MIKLKFVHQFLKYLTLQIKHMDKNVLTVCLLATSNCPSQEDNHFLVPTSDVETLVVFNMSPIVEND